MEEFKKELRKRNRHYREGEFEVIEIIDEGRVLTKSKFGECISRYWDLLRGFNPTIETAIDKNKYFKNVLKDRNPNFFRQVKLISEYKKSSSKVRFKTEFGIIAISPSEAYRVKKINISSAEDKKEFFIKESRKRRENFEDTDYSKFKVEGYGNKRVFICKKHGVEYLQNLHSHKRNIQGCAFCMKQIIMYTEENFKNNKEFFKDYLGIFYVMRLRSKEESFYKIGITGLKRLNGRKRDLERIYEVDLVYHEEGLIKDKFDLEQRFLKEFEGYQYSPKKKFKGQTECLSVNPVEEYYQYFNKR